MSDPSSIHAVYLHNYFHLMGISILYYDYLITFGDEYWRIWKRPKSRAAALFFLNRYLAVLGDVAVNVGNFYIFRTEESCGRYAFFRQLLLVICQVVVGVILCLRTYALYARDIRVLIFILTLGFSLVGLSCWAIVGQKQEIFLDGGCHTAAEHVTAIHLAVPWEAQVLYDSAIFSLTLYKTYKERFRHLMITGRRDLVTLVFRDGAIYFAVMAIVNLANTLTFYFLQPLLRGVLSTFASSVSVTMMSRVMLNLHESVAGSDVIDTSTTLTASEDFTSLMFTSRITTHPDAPDALRFRESVYVSPEDPLTGEGHIEEVYELQELHPPHVHPKV